MANKARVVYVDGTASQEVFLRPKATIAAERKYGAAAQGDRQVEASLYMVWYTLGMPGGTDGFTAWLDNVDEVEQVTDEGAVTGDGAADPPTPVSSEPFPT